MMLHIRNTLIFIFVATYASIACANSGVSVGYGSGTKEIKGYRFNLQRAWGTRIQTENKRRITGYWELGFTKMHNPVTYSFPTNNDMEATSLSLVLRIPVRVIAQWYFDIGIGGAYLTKEQIGTRNLGTKWLFEDRLGAGVLLGERKQYEVGYRLVHYSNGYLAQTNQGLNLHLLILGFWF